MPAAWSVAQASPVTPMAGSEGKEQTLAERGVKFRTCLRFARIPLTLQRTLRSRTNPLTPSSPLRAAPVL